MEVMERRVPARRGGNYSTVHKKLQLAAENIVLNRIGMY